VYIQVESLVQDIYVTPKLLERWFAIGGDRASYGDRLQQALSKKEVAQVQSIMTQQLCHRTIAWHSAIAYVMARRGSKIND
jgi:putative ATPase